MEKESFGFFSDIKSRLLLFVVGLASLYTFVPSIINQSEEFFGIDKIWSYRIFIALYFVLPLLLPTLACLNFAWRFYRKDTEYYEGGTFSDDKIEEEKIEPKYQKYSIIALFIIAISFVLLCVFLFYNSKYYTFIFFGCALFLILACLSMATYYSVKKQISNKKEKTQHHKEWTEVRFQYFLLTILFTTICSIFFYNNFFKIDEKTKKVRKTQLDFNINAPEVIKF
ncbi:MAG TPA: hypothetical protein VGE24_04335, partial [Emticicia sp.]